MRQGGRKRPCKDNEQGLIPSENEQNLHFALAHNLRFSVSLLAWNSDVAGGGFASLSLTHFQSTSKRCNGRAGPHSKSFIAERDTACIDSHSTLFALKQEKGY
jgi:hypothetical protein